MTITLFFVLATVAASLAAWKNDAMMRKWIFNPYLVASQNEYFRFLTSGFIHKDTLHLIFNLFVLYMFGEYVEYQFQGFFGMGLGSVLYILLYLGGIIISDIPTFLKHRTNPQYNALGASGGVASVLFCFVFLRPLEPLCLYGISFLCFPGILWAVIYLVYSVYAGRKQIGNINHDAHLYGALFGILFTLAIYPPSFMLFIEQMKNFQLF